MKVRVFMKRLAEVEINPRRSNQHEFNAGILRRELGFKNDPTQGHVEFLFYKADGAEPVAVRERYTLYDARRDRPGRTEWRLYYTNRRVAAHARADDLMLLFRPVSRNADLVAVVARQGTAVERALAKELVGCEPEELGDKLFVDSGNIDPGTRRLLLRALEGSGSPPDVTNSAVTSHRLLERFVGYGDMPSTQEMAATARRIVTDLGINPLDSDEFIWAALDAETELFMAIESEIGDRKLQEAVKEGRYDFHKVMQICTSFSQRRRSRRGQSLENHFRFLLEQLGIPHGYQCTTERGRKPDFVFPSCEHYRNPDFPANRLRMVGCKTLVRERYTQWLGEALRVRVKYALCVDPGLSDQVVLRYRNRLRFFMPRKLLADTYAHRVIRGLLGSVTDLIEDLRPSTTRASRQ